MTPHVYRSRAVYGVLALALLVGGIVWLSRHVTALAAGDAVSPLYGLLSVVFLGFLALAWLERPKTATSSTDAMRVTVNVPVYNEDPAIVRQVLDSILEQTRRPERIEVVDDGSTIDYGDLPAWWAQAANERGIDGSWVRIANGGKRSAQVTTFGADTDADVFVTVDSDSLLAPDAIAQGLLPLSDPSVSSVAGLVVAMNARKNIITRLTDMMFLNFQLVTRSALSALDSVLVNSGCLAFYRADVVRNVIDGYTSETFAGKPVHFSDDSYLTLAAYMTGKTVQQPTAVAFTYLPEKISHHLRQQYRWFKGSTIRSIWRARYLPIDRAAYWIHAINWANYLLISGLFVYLLVYRPAVGQTVSLWLVAIAAAISYATSLKYLTYRRSDIPFAWQLGTFAMAPLLSVWSALVLRPLRLYAIITVFRPSSWGTRTAGVEVAKA